MDGFGLYTCMLFSDTNDVTNLMADNCQSTQLKRRFIVRSCEHD